MSTARTGAYYEHCSYWSPGSLARAFRIAGFDPLQVWTDYDDQYVLIAARPGAGNGKILSNEEPPAALAAKVRGFTEAVAVDRARWRDWLERLRRAGQKTVLWGGGSKAVAFLTTLDVTEGPDYAVDINPRRNGTFIAGTGQQIVLPEFLAQHQPDVVIVMSPIYLPEITAQLEGLGVHPNCLAPSRRPPPPTPTWVRRRRTAQPDAGRAMRPETFSARTGRTYSRPDVRPGRRWGGRLRFK